MGNCFRQEFRLKNVRLQHSPAEDFCKAQWKWPSWLFVLYRVSAAIYTSGWSITALVDLLLEGQIRALAYLTQWTFILTTLYHVWAASTSISHLISSVCRKDVPNTDDNLNYSKNEENSEISCGKSDTKNKCISNERLLQSDQETEFNKEIENTYERPLVEKLGDKKDETSDVHVCNSTTVLVHQSPESDHLPWNYKVQWILLTLVSVSNIVITVIYFAFLYPWLLTFNYKPSAFDINFHAVFTLLSILDLLIIRVHVRVLHCIYVVCYGIVYFVFSLVFWACDNEDNILYPSILDWNKPGTSVLSTTAIIFVLMPSVQLLLYGIFRLRNYVGEKR